MGAMRSPPELTSDIKGSSRALSVSKGYRRDSPRHFLLWEWPLWKRSTPQCFVWCSEMVREWVHNLHHDPCWIADGQWQHWDKRGRGGRRGPWRWQREQGKDALHPVRPHIRESIEDGCQENGRYETSPVPQWTNAVVQCVSCLSAVSQAKKLLITVVFGIKCQSHSMQYCVPSWSEYHTLPSPSYQTHPSSGPSWQF